MTTQHPSKDLRPSEDLPPGEFWDIKFDSDTYVYGFEPAEFIRAQFVDLPPKQSVFVPGDGEGRHGVWIAAQSHDVLTVDASAVGQRKAMAMAKHKGAALEAQVADLMDWSWPAAQFDVIVSVYLHLPPEVRQFVHAQMVAALKPGGKILLEGFRPDQLKCQAAGSRGGPKRLDMLFTPQMLQQDFATLVPISVEEIDIHSPADGFHQGDGCIVQAVFQKQK